MGGWQGTLEGFVPVAVLGCLGGKGVCAGSGGRLTVTRKFGYLEGSLVWGGGCFGFIGFRVPRYSAGVPWGVVYLLGYPRVKYPG